MSTPNEDALYLANKLASGWPELEHINTAVIELRRLVAENEAQAALLRQALKVIQHGTGWMTNPNLIAAIRQHLGQKGETG